MQAKFRRISVISGFLLLLALLIANTTLIHRQVTRQVQSHAAVIHTNLVLVQIEQVESLLKDAETGQRGYLYTGEPAYLEPYNNAQRQIDRQLYQLTLLTADNPRQQEHVARLHILAQTKLQEIAETLAMYQAGRTEEARNLVLTNIGRHTMDEIRRLLEEMTQEEQRLDAERTASYAETVRVTKLAVFLTSSLAALGLIGLAYSIVNEMRTREHHASDLLERESWFRITLASVGDAVIATNPSGHVRYLNAVAEQLIGKSLAQVEGKSIDEAFPIFNEQTNARVENPVAKVMASGLVIGLANHTVLRHASGRLIPIEDSAAPIRDANNNLIGVVLVFRDATQERKTQEVLRKTEKLAAAARLASTMAHEINNPLEAIGNLIYLAKLVEPLPEDARQLLSRADEELQRVSHITRQTLGFYREARAPQSTEIAPLVESVLKLFNNKLRSKNVEVTLDFKPAPAIFSYSGEVKQVVANLLSNAIDAVARDGKITVGVAPVSGKDGVEITVRDNGSGIRDEDLPRIFEPFYTTKQDVGTGLGLWVVKEIAERHNGVVRVDTNTDGAHGTTFTVFLPSNAQVQSAGVAS